MCRDCNCSEIYEKWKKQIGSRREYAGYEKAYSYGKDKFQLWYEVEDRSEQILCQERTDAFVVAVLYFAMVTGEDIEYEGVLSNELYHNLNTNLIPMHCNESKWVETDSDHRENRKQENRKS